MAYIGRTLFLLILLSIQNTAFPDDIKIIKDIAYGSDELQKLDVYTGVDAENLPIIFMVHGGAWKAGDKASQALIKNKVKRWVPDKYLVVSINYRLYPNANPVTQAQDIAQALSYVQKNSSSWGGDPGKVILMGHSAGGHLISLVSSSLDRYKSFGVKPAIGSIILDTNALNTDQLMQLKHPRFYDKIFGENPDFWKDVSPFHRLTSNAAPFLIVCSSLISGRCVQADAFAEKALSKNVNANVLKIKLSHRKINQSLGLQNRYTIQVEKFINSLVSHN